MQRGAGGVGGGGGGGGGGETSKNIGSVKIVGRGSIEAPEYYSYAF